MNEWRRTSAVSATLADARRQLHWAAQAAAGAGRTLVPPRADDSHTSFTWSADLEALLQEPVRKISAGLRPRDLTLLAVIEENVVSALPLRGRTLADAFVFFENVFAAPLKRPGVDLPMHAVSDGARFFAGDGDLARLADHYANAAAICSEVEGGSAVRCWPHHFDMATLITISGEGESARTVGVGLSPGDSTYEEPYYYVNAWPSADAAGLRALPHGHWHTSGWTGAVLTASELAAIDDQQPAVQRFVREASGQLRQLVGEHV